MKWKKFIIKNVEVFQKKFGTPLILLVKKDFIFSLKQD
jgi:hypothetical protein